MNDVLNILPKSLTDNPAIKYVSENPWKVGAGVVAGTLAMKYLPKILETIPTLISPTPKPSFFGSSLFKKFQSPADTAIGGKLKQLIAPTLTLAALGIGLKMFPDSKQTDALKKIQEATKKAAEPVKKGFCGVNEIHLSPRWKEFADAGKKMWTRGIANTKDDLCTAKNMFMGFGLPGLGVASALAIPFVSWPVGVLMNLPAAIWGAKTLAKNSGVTFK